MLECTLKMSCAEVQAPGHLKCKLKLFWNTTMVDTVSPYPGCISCSVYGCINFVIDNLPGF